MRLAKQLCGQGAGFERASAAKGKTDNADAQDQHRPEIRLGNGGDRQD